MRNNVKCDACLEKYLTRLIYSFTLIAYRAKEFDSPFHLDVIPCTGDNRRKEMKSRENKSRKVAKE